MEKRMKKRDGKRIKKEGMGGIIEIEEREDEMREMSDAKDKEDNKGMSTGQK